MRLQVQRRTSEYADFELSVRAKGCFAAAVSWATEEGPLPDWSFLAMIPIDPAGNGSCRFVGHRAVPAEATHLYVRGIVPDFSGTEEALVKFPDGREWDGSGDKPAASFSIMSDLHLSGRPGRVSRALGMAESGCILIPGDLTNDGLPEQFGRFRECVEETALDRLVLAVPGNHDRPYKPDPETAGGYDLFQEYLLGRAEERGRRIETDGAGMYAVTVDGVDVIGVPCVNGERKFLFPDERQLRWLEERLDRTGIWHVILCHAPLLAHNPHRNDGPPYLSGNDRLQRLIDGKGNVIFLSGHTHESPNGQGGSVMYVPERRVLYVDSGSVAPTELGGEPLMPAGWKDGVIFELRIYAQQLEVRARSIHTGAFYPRGYYRFDTALERRDS